MTELQLKNRYHNLVSKGKGYKVEIVPGIKLDCGIFWDVGEESTVLIDNVICSKKSKGAEIITGFLANGLHEDDLHDFVVENLKNEIKAYNESIKIFLLDAQAFHKNNKGKGIEFDLSFDEWFDTCFNSMYSRS